MKQVDESMGENPLSIDVPLAQSSFIVMLNLVLWFTNIFSKIERRMFMLMALKRNQKGLTLIELLAVLVIVGIIAAIAIPAIGNTISNSKSKADTASDQLIQEAAQRYIIDLPAEPTSTTVTISITTDLVANGYLTKAPTFNDGKVRTVTATKSNTNGWTILVSKPTT